MLGFLPHWTCQLDFPNRAARVELALHSDERGSLTAENPNVNFFGLLPYNGGHYSSQAANLRSALAILMALFSGAAPTLKALGCGA
jgi:hypothetical protein